jgi:putative cardiolipin synthase
MTRSPEQGALAWAALAALLALSGCAPTLRLDAARQASQAIPSQTMSTLKSQLDARIPPGRSGFHLLQDGHAALAARLALAQRANHALDVQYYLFQNDTSGKLFAATLLAAAERGVRVRLLIDDIDTADKALGLAALDAHPNIEVRLFNPFRTRSTNLLVWGWQALRESVRLNRRMHNKAFIADNQIAIAGGRNIGDEYFDVHRELAFIDLDVIAAGEVVDALSRSFDRYWNSVAAVPASALPVMSAKRLQRTSVVLQQFRAEQLAGEQARALAAADPLPALLDGTRPWHIADADLIVDPPEKVLVRNKAPSKLLLGQLAGLGIQPERRVLIVSPYFVPGAAGMAYFDYWRSRGVHIDVLTNAYAASDVPIVHAGYANYRERLLEAGVDLYELKPVGELVGPRLRNLGGGSSRASLHAKAFVFDEKHVFIGSFNFDPRSTRLNTEMGLVIHSPELARQVTAIAGSAMRPERSYRPRLVREKNGHKLARRLQWHDVAHGTPRVLDDEPGLTPLHAGVLRVLQALPIEEHL